MSKEEQDTGTSSTVSTVAKSTGKISTTSGSSGKTLVNCECRYCGEQLNNVEEINGKIKCPHCEKEF